MENKLCKDCKFYKLSIMDIITDCEGECIHEKNWAINNVTGRKTLKSFPGLLRNGGWDSCSREGYWFERQ